MSDLNRNAGFVVKVAETRWAEWLPGDGTRYSVRIVAITEGADYSDRVLLVSVGRRCAAFQCPSAEYRLQEIGPWTKKRAKEHGVVWAWAAARPLLDQLGVAKHRREKRAVVTVELPEVSA